MKKIITLGVLVLILNMAWMFSNGAQAATTDFTASADVNIDGVTITTGGTTGMRILSGSTAESFSVTSGVFTVTNPGSAFKIASTNPSITRITVTRGGSQVACLLNSQPGSSSLTLPIDVGTYTITPDTTGSCGGGGSSAPGTSGTISAATPTYQTYTPSTGVTTTDGDAIDATDTTIPNSTESTDTAAEAAENATQAEADTNLASIKSEASKIFTDARSGVAQAVKKAIDAAKESEYDKSIVGKVVSSVASVSSAVRERILTFVTYGSVTTDALGAGERGGVVNSFKEAFGKLPENEADWEDVIKIANGRWPGQTSASREKTAEGNFQAIYLRAPDRSNPHDDAAVVIMAYGLRSRNRNLDSEKTAILTYKHIFNRNPVSATSWDAVRAIAYSGATR